VSKVMGSKTRFCALIASIRRPGPPVRSFVDHYGKTLYGKTLGSVRLANLKDRGFCIAWWLKRINYRTFRNE